MKNLIILIVVAVIVYIWYSLFKNATLPEWVPFLEQTESVSLGECEEYIRENITTLSPVEEVLWWTWYVTKVAPEGENYIVSYEDWHIVNNIEVSCEKINGNVEVEVIENLWDTL